MRSSKSMLPFKLSIARLIKTTALLAVMKSIKEGRERLFDFDSSTPESGSGSCRRIFQLPVSEAIVRS